jgi:hypothetical protein
LQPSASPEVLPNAEHRVLAGQTHNVAAAALAPVLRGFFEPRVGSDGAKSSPSTAITNSGPVEV